MWIRVHRRGVGSGIDLRPLEANTPPPRSFRIRAVDPFHAPANPGGFRFTSFARSPRVPSNITQGVPMSPRAPRVLWSSFLLAAAVATTAIGCDDGFDPSSSPDDLYPQAAQPGPWSVFLRTEL